MPDDDHLPEAVYLVDGSAYIYRAYHAIRGLSNANGLPTNAVYGFTTILRRIIRERSPAYLAVAFDSRGEVFRHKIYPDYKANRPPMPDDLQPQIPYIHQVVHGYNLLEMEEGDQEADDLIASAACKLADQGVRVVIVSGDKDLLQLVSDSIVLWDPMSDKSFDPAGVREKYGVSPEQLLDFFALTGDASDNIPGVPGIGPKTARKLISSYGSLEGIYEALDSMKQSRMKERLRAHREDAFLSRELIRLNTSAPVPEKLECYAVRPPDTKLLRTLFTELEFHSLLKEEAKGGRIDTEHFVLVESRDQLAALVDNLSNSEILVLDTETTSLDALHADLVGVSLCVNRETAWYIPCGHRDEEGHLCAGQLRLTDLVQLLRPLLEDETLPKLGHNLKYDLQVLASERNGGIKVAGPLYDTMVAAWLLDPGRRSYKLDDLCREIGLEMTSFAEVTGATKHRQGEFARVSLERARDYSCEDVYGTLALFERQRPRLEELDLWPLFADLETPLIPVLARMEEAGICVDESLLVALSEEFAAKLASLEQEIHDLAGRKFNINSPQQLGTVLFDELKLPRGRKTKTGYSTDVRVLEKLAGQHELPALILRYRNLAKLKSTYVDSLIKLREKNSGRIHTSFNQCGTATGRLSSSNPNLQNIPIRSEEGRRIRAAFVAAPGCLLLASDYSQIDLRVLAHYSRDRALLEAFGSGLDIHRQTAAQIFFVDPSLVTAEMRRVAKTINFGIIYGMSSYGLANQLDLSRKEAQTFIDRYFEHYQGIKQFMKDIVDQAREKGYVTTLMGRRRVLPDIRSRNRTRREFAERTAINTPIQGTAADIIKLAMLEVDRQLQQHNCQGRMLLQVHDELVIEVPKEEVEQTATLVQQAMEGVMELAVPLEVHITVGSSLDKS